jgi:hypothetical protein
VTNNSHKGKREPLGREESKPESISLPAGVSRMCVFPAPNSARLARNFPLFRLIRPVQTTFGSLAGRIPLQREKTARPVLRLLAPTCSHLRLFPMKIFSHDPATPPSAIRGLWSLVPSPVTRHPSPVTWHLPRGGPIVFRRKPLIVKHFRTLDDDVRPILLKV